MKNVWMSLILTAAAFGADRPGPDIIVLVHAGNENSSVVAMAEGEAQKMLAEAGIHSQWSGSAAHDRGEAEVIEIVFTEQPDDTCRPGVLGYAMLGLNSGTRITIFYNRVRAHGTEASMPRVLAHVMVHEVTHILEGVNRHSETGIMKAHWTEQDWTRNRFAPMPFADEDLRLLHQWSDLHHHTLLAAAR